MAAFVLNGTGNTLKTTGFALNMTEFAWNIIGFFLYIYIELNFPENYLKCPKFYWMCLQKSGLVINITGFS